MNNNQAAKGRRAQCVRILSQFPILVQDKDAKVSRGKKKKTTKVLAGGIQIVIRESRAGEILIEFKPP